MVWYFINVYVVNRALHDRFELRHFSSVDNTRKDGILYLPAGMC